MINFTHKACCPDENKVEKIAKRIKKRGKIKSNHLESLISKHLDTKHITPLKISEIEDFVRLTPKKLNSTIFLGSYQQKQAKSYLDDIISTNKAYLVNETAFNKQRSEFSKIIAVEISSRHRRGEKKNECKGNNHMDKLKHKYKVFLEYVPKMKSSKSIKGI